MYKNVIRELAIADQFADAQVEALSESTNKLLRLLIEVYGQKMLAEKLSDLGLDIDRESLNKWKKAPLKYGIRIDGPSQTKIRKALLPERPAHYSDPSFTFIDLFAGIGGLRQGFDAIGGKCLFTNEWDDQARRTYLANHYVDDSELAYFLDSEEENPKKNTSFMDIQKITLSESGKATRGQIKTSINKHIPDHDVLIAGFPCQPFSLAGVSKKNSLGRSHGFECESQGTLFFDVEKIIEVKQPKFFLLENVKNLKSHDQGNTFAVIIRALDRLGYWIADISDEDEDIEEVIKRVRKRKPEPVVIDGQNFIPQHRERVVLLGVRKDIEHKDLSLRNIRDFAPKKRTTLKDVLDERVDKKYTLTDNLWEYLFNYAIKHKKKGNGFGFGLVDPNDENAVCRTLSARYYKDGSEILINFQGLNDKYLQKANDNPIKFFKKKYKKPRRLTPQECARLMGFEKPQGCRDERDTDFVIPVSDTRAYKQFGNSVVVPVFKAVAELMRPVIEASARQEQADAV
jgi:DNA (cytosine-5)-methyltransferase 1